MSTSNFSLNPEVKTILGAKLHAQWAKRLKTSVQFMGGFCNDHDSARCCLCELFLLEFPDSPFDAYSTLSVPLKGKGAKIDALFPITVDGVEKAFSQVNDSLLTHEEINTLLRTGKVTVEDAFITHTDRVYENNKKNRPN